MLSVVAWSNIIIDNVDSFAVFHSQAKTRTKTFLWCNRYLTIEGFCAEGDNVHLPCLSIVHVFALNTSLYRPLHHACFTTYCESQRDEQQTDKITWTLSLYRSLHEDVQTKFTETWVVENATPTSNVLFLPPTILARLYKYFRTDIATSFCSLYRSQVTMQTRGVICTENVQKTSSVVGNINFGNDAMRRTTSSNFVSS